MKPGDHPQFFKMLAPFGASRVSDISLGQQGQFYLKGELIEHPKLVKALRTWLRRHPDNGEVILSNDYDWCYLSKIDGYASWVHGLSVERREEAEHLVLELWTGERVTAKLESLWSDGEEVILWSMNKQTLTARFSPAALLQLEPYLVEIAPGEWSLQLGDSLMAIRSGPLSRPICP